MTDQDMLSALVDMVHEAEEATETARKESERDRDYKDGKQWTPDEVAELQKRKQPPVVINRIKPKVDALMGLERSQRVDPKALPRNPTDEDSAKAATQALRFVSDNVSLDAIRTRAMENLYVEGTGAAMWNIRIMPDGKKELDLKRVAWDRFIHDPRSSELDFSDACYLGEVLWMDVSKAVVKFPHFKEQIKQTYNTHSEATDDETYEDKPRFDQWADKRRKRVRIVRLFHLKGEQWHQALFTKTAVFKDHPLPFVDENGESFHPMVAVSAFIDRENNRYGLVRQMISPQDEINKRRSKYLHQLSTNRIRVDRSQSHRKEELRREAAKPDGVIIADVGEVDELNNVGLAQGQAQLYQDGKDELDAVGINPTLQGKADGGLSGRAIQAQQQAGMLELGPILEARQVFNLMAFRKAWWLIKQFWDDERWIRVTDSQGKPEFTGINRPMTVGEALEAEFGGIPEELEGLPELQQPAQENGEPVRENVLADLDIDITIEEGADISTLQGEQFEMLSSSGVLNILAQADPTIVIELMPNLLDKERILERLTGGGKEVSPEQQAAMQQQERQSQIIEAKELAGIEETQSRTELNAAKAQKEALVV